MAYRTVADDVDESKDALDGEDVRQHRPPGPFGSGIRRRGDTSWQRVPVRQLSYVPRQR
jgi:hypothetical protein